MSHTIVPPRVSVIIAAYNVEGYVERAIASVQAQTRDFFEIVVADDGSTDMTCQVVERLAARDARVRLVRCEKNGGPSVARNLGIEAAEGEWIAILDADDMWTTQRLECLIGAAESSDATIIADNFLRLDEATGRIIGAAFREPRPFSAMTPHRLIRSEHPAGRIRFGLIQPIVRRKFLNDHNIRYPTSIRYAEDFHFFMRVLLEGGKGVLVSEPHYIYALPQSPTTGATSQGTRTRVNLRDRVWIADDLIERYENKASPDVILALRRYRGWMEDVANGKETLDLWRRGAHWRALGSALARPRAAVSYALACPTIKRLQSRLQGSLARAPV